MKVIHDSKSKSKVRVVRGEASRESSVVLMFEVYAGAVRTLEKPSYDVCPPTKAGQHYGRIWPLTLIPS